MGEVVNERSSYDALATPGRAPAEGHSLYG